MVRALVPSRSALRTAHSDNTAAVAQPHPAVTVPDVGRRGPLTLITATKHADISEAAVLAELLKG
jgi:uncharacterized protein YeaO (DUF488 family)